MAWLWVILSICCTCLGQVLQKLAVAQIAKMENQPILNKLMQPYLLLAILALGLGALAWLLVLQYFPVSMAYPLLAINFVVMTLVARFGFNESISKQRYVGIGFIVLGVVLMGSGL